MNDSPVSAALTSSVIDHLRDRLFHFKRISIRPRATQFEHKLGFWHRAYTGFYCSADKPVSATAFPQQSMVGSLGDLARALGSGTEVPEEFLFASALTAFGAMCAPDLRVRIGLPVSTRFYTVLLGKSYEARKSSAMKRILEFFNERNFPVRAVTISHGVGSAEGLAKTIQKNPKLILAFDEFRAFLDKAGIKNSTLLSMAASLYEQENWDNATKETAVTIRGALLSIIGCCTTETYEGIWSAEALAIGLPNRLFVIDADAKPRIAWPSQPDPAELETIRLRIVRQLDRLPVTYDAAPEAKQTWETWYDNLARSEHSKRLDVLAFRLMPLLALTTDKDAIDTETVERTIAILNYELAVRTATDPIDADNTIAKLEEAIRRQLKVRGSLSKAELRKYTNAPRYGHWFFDTALKNLITHQEMVPDSGKYRLAA
ncbi:MAG TPA: hypothetical protein VGX94_12060 [Terriglobia bacterium]|nr:hypothetical protein [Terriglobia bacterium]